MRALLLSVLLVLAAIVVVPTAQAVYCPRVEVVFARGTFEPPAVGLIGQTLIDQLQARVGPVGVYGVNYPASMDFQNSVVAGVSDAAAHISAVAAECPNTAIVLGGYSQGAAVAGYVTAAVVPDGVPEGVPNALSAAVAAHVRAVVLFGMPSPGWLGLIGVSVPIVVGMGAAQYCADGDAVCSGEPQLIPSPAHQSYVVNGMVGAAADYITGRV